MPRCVLSTEEEACAEAAQPGSMAL
jgi:hypothetical protein